MRPHVDPERFRRIPSEALNLYRRTVSAGGAPGALDDARGVVKVGLWIAGLFFGLFLLWAALAPMSGAAVASGVVTVAGERLSVQPATGGIVGRVLVSEGQAVRAGQILVRMNGTTAGARLEQTDARWVALTAAQARLTAERDDLPAIVWPTALSERQGEAVVAQSMANQTALFDRNRAVTLAERRIGEARLGAARAQSNGALRQLALIRDELADIRGLYNRGFAPRSRLRALERAAVDLETEVASTAAAEAEAGLTVTRTEAERAARTVEQLRVVQEGLAQTRPDVRVTRTAAERDVLRAPFAGQVVNLKPLGAGSVVGAGEAMLDILPEGPALVVEARIKPQDVDDVQVGSVATVRLTTVEPRRRSAFDGRVTTLSPDRIVDPQTGEAYYLARIAIDGDQVRAADVALRAGLPATVNVTTERRTFLQYIFQPLSDAFSGAMREE